MRRHAEPRAAETSASDWLSRDEAGQLALRLRACIPLMCGARLTVCRGVIGAIDASVTMKQRESVEEVEKVMRSWCDTSKGKDKTMCYYMGVGDAEQVRAAASEAPAAPHTRSSCAHLRHQGSRREAQRWAGWLL